MELRLDIDMREVERRLTGGLARQIPFATSRALNKLAARGRDHTKGKLPTDFTIRSPWVAKGIRANNSNKRDLVAEVGSVDEFMRDQATGAPAEGAIPMVGRGKPRATIKSKTPKSRWPGSSRWGDKFVGWPYYQDRTDRAASSYGLWQRIVKPGRGPAYKRKGLRLLYVFMFGRTRHEALAKNKSLRKWPLPDYVEEVVRKHSSEDLAAALEEAIRTAR